MIDSHVYKSHSRKERQEIKKFTSKTTQKIVWQSNHSHNYVSETIIETKSATQSWVIRTVKEY